ncbi:MAG: hypothetical protein ACRDZ8_00195 [Acidimicrobiales bacterium]
MTTTLSVRAELVEAALLSSGGETRNRVTTLPFITGSALRGALAARWLRANGHLRPGRPPAPVTPDSRRREFLRVFESGLVRFPYLYPSGVGPAPLTRYVYKQDPARHVVDTADPRRISGNDGGCARCGPDLQRASGSVQIGHSIRTRTAVAEAGQAAEGYLYAQEELDEGQAFQGVMTIGDDLGLDFGEWLPIGETVEVHLGGDRSTGGQAAVSIKAARLRPVDLSSRRTNWLAVGLPADTVVLTARSPLIFTDRWLRPAEQFRSGDLEVALGIGGISLVRGTIGRPRLAGGWNPAAGVPKPADVALVEGSVALFTVPAIDEALLGRLAAAETAGIGWRRAEGFGSVVMWDTEHLRYYPDVAHD